MPPIDEDLMELPEFLKTKAKRFLSRVKNFRSKREKNTGIDLGDPIPEDDRPQMFMFRPDLPKPNLFSDDENTD